MLLYNIATQANKRMKKQCVSWPEEKKEFLISLHDAKTLVKKMAKILDVDAKQVKNKLAALQRKRKLEQGVSTEPAVDGTSFHFLFSLKLQNLI